MKTNDFNKLVNFKSESNCKKGNFKRKKTDSNK